MMDHYNCRTRGPSLASIGRSCGLDMETPPDWSESDVTVGLQPDTRGEYHFEAEHAELTAKEMKRCFCVMNPGHHICRRPPSRSSAFSHSTHGVVIGSRYAQLRQLLENKARLQLVRNYTSRIHSLQNFVKDVKHLVEEEYSTWYNIEHNSMAESPTTRLEYLNVLCEDLRVHVKHWSSIKQFMHSEKWLRPLLPGLCLEIDIVRRTLHRLRDCALWWIDKLIKVGLQVLAHADPEQLTHDVLWNITRGLEEYNSVVMFVRLENATFSKNQIQIRCTHGNVSADKPSNAHVNFLDPLTINSLKYLGEGVRRVPFLRVLNILANERSKYPAIMTHRFLSGSSEFLELILSNKLPEYSWDDDYQESGSKFGEKGPNRTRNGQTSDYHSASTVSLSAAMLRVGSIRAPDLSKEMSPVIDFARREQEFASRFLQIVCHSTGLLKRPSSANTKKASVMGGAPVQSQNNHKKSGVIQDEDDRSLNDSRRKTVSWGDAYDDTLRAQLTERYMELLWQNFGSNLWSFWQEHAWGVGEDCHNDLGHLMLCPDTVVMLLACMMKQLCVKDMFPVDAVQSVSNVVCRMHSKAAWSAWDKGVCSAFASMVTDKCYPTPLIDGYYSTKTARLIRDTYRPLISVFMALQDSLQDHNDKGTNGVIHGRNSQMPLLVATFQRIAVSTSLATRWCDAKSHQFLSSWAVGSFLLLTQSDLKMLADETRQVLTLSQATCSQCNHRKKQIEIHLTSELSKLWHQLNHNHAQMQALSGSLLKQFAHKCHLIAVEFFQDAMPVGKLWRKKSSQELPTEHNDYVDHALDTLLDPVVDGVSKLPPSVQIGILSLTITEICYAWTGHILKSNIHFSLHGAHQLQLDFTYLRTWLDGFLTDSEVRQSVMSLDIFRYLSGVIDILKRQPQGGIRRPWQDSSCELSTATSEQSLGSLNGSIGGISSDMDVSRHSDSEPNIYKVPDMEQWLALRVRGGTRNWKFPSCFNPTVTRK